MPLDDVILAILGIGMLLLLPTFLPIMADKAAGVVASYRSSVRSTVAFLFLIYLISIVGLGIYIEFHEGFFGGGEGSAPGTMNDLAFIRGHLLFGFMILPALFVGLLSLEDQVSEKVGYVSYLASWITVFTALLGASGMYFWTFHLDAVILKWCYGATLLSLAAMVYGQWRLGSIHK